MYSMYLTYMVKFFADELDFKKSFDEEWNFNRVEIFIVTEGEFKLCKRIMI